MKTLLPLTAIVFISCTTYTPPSIPDKAPKAQISMSGAEISVDIAINQSCRPRMALGNPSILALNNQYHGTNGNKEKKIKATEFMALVEADKTHTVSPIKSYPGRTTYSWVKTGTAPIMVPVTELNFCNFKSLKWTPRPEHKYQLIINKTGNGTCDFDTKIVDLAQPNINTASDEAKLCE